MGGRNRQYCPRQILLFCPHKIFGFANLFPLSHRARKLPIYTYTYRKSQIGTPLTVSRSLHSLAKYWWPSMRLIIDTCVINFSSVDCMNSKVVPRTKVERHDTHIAIHILYTCSFHAQFFFCFFLF